MIVCVGVGVGVCVYVRECIYMYLNRRTSSKSCTLKTKATKPAHPS